MRRSPLRLSISAALAVALLVFLYYGSTSVIYRVSGINLRFPNLPVLYEAMQTYQGERAYAAFVRSFMQGGAAFMRYDLYGEHDDLIARYIAHKDQFLPIENLRLKKVCAPLENVLDDGNYMQFGARIVVLPDIDGDSLPDTIGVSYLGSKHSLHFQRHFSAVVDSLSLAPFDGSLVRMTTESRLFEQFFSTKSYRDLNVGSYYRPFG